jgi:predicted GNAT superfamily acetyltransferase
MIIRDLTSLEDCQQVVRLQKDVWGYADGEDVVPVPVLIVSIKRGGILIGAFEGERLVGFVYSVPALKDGRLTQWSDMLGVTRAARGSGLGLRLKLAQRERALAMGIEIIEWTFDPMQALNAHLNMARLGAIAEEYEENLYGETSSPLHRGVPTDRLVALWKLTAPHVERRIQPSGLPVARDASVMAAPVVNTSRNQDPAEPDVNSNDRRVLIEVPATFTEMLTADPPRAHRWRMTTRLAFQTYFARGYRAVDFLLSADRRRGHYLLERTAMAVNVEC